MGRYIFQRLLRLIPAVWLVITIVFFIFRLIPGDLALIIAGYESSPEDVAEIRRELGLDDPLYVQYFRYLGGVLRGDLGQSKIYGADVTEQLLKKAPASLELAVAAMLIAIVVGVGVGITSAVRQNSIYDYGSMLLAVSAVSVPSFWLGLILIMVFSVQLHILPTSGRGGLANLILPAVTLAAGQAALIARLTRSSMLEVIRQDYVRTARAKGLRDRTVITRHVLKNALIPTITVIGLQLGFLLGGSIVVETVFSWPGLGFLLIDAVRSRDYFVVQGAILLYAAAYMLVNLIVDISYVYLNPQVRYD